MVSNGIANIPVAGSNLGVIKVTSGSGLAISGSGVIEVVKASDNAIKFHCAVESLYTKLVSFEI